MQSKVRKKPTNKEMTNAIIEINKKVNDCFSICRELDNIIGLYISMKGDMKEFNKHIEEKVKEREKNDAKTNGDTDGKNLQGNTEDESSRTERVRQKQE